MRSFTIGDVQLDVVSSGRTFNPGRFQGGVSEWFEIDAWKLNRGGRIQGPLDWYPNTNPHPHPDAPQRMVFIWTGKQAQPVYENQGTEESPNWVQVGMKRGGDFRSRYWKSIVRRLRKAQAAERLGIVVGQVLDADIDTSAFTEPVNLRTSTLNDAHLALVGEVVQERPRPRGTIENIDCTFNSYADAAGGEVEGGAGINNVNVRQDDTASLHQRTQLRFPLSSLPTGATINDADLQVNKTSENVEAGEDVNVHAYNATGDDDPDADTGATKFSRSAGGTALVGMTGDGAGSITVDLTATADLQIEGNIDSPDIYSLGLINNGTWEDNEQVQIEAIDNPGTDPPTLIVDYTEVVSTVVKDLIGGFGIVVFAR